MKIGILGTAYNAVDSVERTLSPWLHAKFNEYGNNEFIISIVSVPFFEYKDIPEFKEDHDTYRKLETLILYEEINYLVTTPLYQTEAEARTMALNPLLIENCDLIWCVDFQDEYYTKETIEKSLDFLKINTYPSWFTFNLRNYVFDNETYLADFFAPPRIFRTKTNGYTIDKFYFDNDLNYKSDITGEIISYKNLPSINFPNNIFAKHYSWLNSNSKRKVEYQMKHFGHCSYKWNEEKNCLEFDKSYYNKFKLPLPEILKD